MEEKHEIVQVAAFPIIFVTDCRITMKWRKNLLKILILLNMGSDQWSIMFFLAKENQEKYMPQKQSKYCNIKINRIDRYLKLSYEKI